MEERYEYRTIRIARGAWRSVAAATYGPATRRLAAAGGSIFGLWRGEIGWHSDEGVVMSAWPADAEPDTTVLDDIDGVVDSSVELLVATVRPTSPDPPTADGVYAHRWFECAERDWPEFLELSQGAWPDFEGAFDGTNIVGFWRSLETPAGLVRVLLVTRYPSLSTWERSRPYAPEAVPGAEQARAKFLRRAELTERTIVRITRLVTA